MTIRFHIAASVALALTLSACGGNAEKERERLQKEIEMARDSLKFYQEELLEANRNPSNCYSDTSSSGNVLEKLKKREEACAHFLNPIRNQVNHFTHIRDSLHRRLKELPPPK